MVKLKPSDFIGSAWQPQVENKVPFSVYVTLPPRTQKKCYKFTHYIPYLITCQAPKVNIP